MDKADLTGRVAIITGGGGGIGSATAERLARAGARVAVADLFLDAARRVAGELADHGLTAEPFQADLANEDEVEALVANVHETFGRVDILHNNAVLNDPEIYSADRTLLDVNPQHWDKIFAVNVKAPMLLAKASIPHMIAQGGGVIVNTSSGAGTIGLPDMLTAYGTSKGALNTLTLYIAAQYGAQNIRCNALVCGAVLTKGLQALFTKEQVAAMEQGNTMKRPTLAEDVAALVHFLVSDDARQITGQLYPI